MKKLAVASILAATAIAANATSLHPDTFRTKFAPELSKAQISEVAKTGKVVTERSHHPYTDFKIEIPAVVSLGSACETFAGVTTAYRATHINVKALSAHDPAMEACIAIMPAPVQTKLLLNVRVVTGGIVAANSIQQRILNIEGLGKFRITLDMDKNSVKVDEMIGMEPRN